MRSHFLAENIATWPDIDLDPYLHKPEIIQLLYINPRPHMLFPHPRTHMGGLHPHAISPLIEIELWDIDQTSTWDVLSPMVPELTSLGGHILTPPGGGKVNKIAIWGFTIFRK